MQLTRRTKWNAARRPAFTLVELLVVLALIAVLGALTAGAAMSVIGRQKTSNTESTLQKTASGLTKHMTAVIEAARKEQIPGSLEDPTSALYKLTVMAMGDPANPAPDIEARRRVIWIKFRLKQEFPMTFAEALDPSAGLFPNHLPRKNHFRVVQGTPSSEHDSAALLYLALNDAGPKGVEFRADTAFAPSEITTEVVLANGTVLNDGLKRIKDAWDKPIGFSRFPYKLEDLNPGGLPQSGKNDSVDTEGLLSNPRWLFVGSTITKTAGCQDFEAKCHEVFPNNLPQPTSPISYRLYPVIASAGRNGQWGVNGALGITDAGQANDNLYSSRLRVGARGD